MAATIPQIIGKVNPLLYAENGKELLKKYGSIDKIPAEKVKPKCLEDSNSGAEASYTIIYESYAETLEPIYYFIIDLMSDFGLSPEKLIDNFTSTPGGTHFSETGMKAVRMQEEATKIMGTINAVVRSILNLVYDLKEFRIRLKLYDDLKSEDKHKSEAARLSLKQIWLDKVDIMKGQSSIKAMALGQAGFQTLLDAFLAVKDEKEVDNLDLNERVKRILRPRIQEFNIWVKESERELRKRYEIERNYLKSQVNSLKLYSRWAKPYLIAAQHLEMKDQGRNPEFVKTFNRVLLELTVFGKSKVDVKKSALAGDLPLEFAKESFLRTIKRDYYSCVLVDFHFRAVPQQGAFLGRAEVTFKAYALNQDELDKMEEFLDQSDLTDALSLIEGATTESLKQLEEEINSFLNEKDSEEKSDEKSNKKDKDDGGNPFLALIGYYNKKDDSGKSKSSDNKEEKKSIAPDNWVEKEYIRKLAAKNAVETAFTLFDTYKKAHRMESYA